MPTRWFTDRRVSTKVVTAVLVAASVAVAIAVLAVTRLGEVDRRSTQVYTDNFVPVTHLADVRRSAMQARLDLLNYAISTTDAERALYQDAMRTDDAAVDSAGQAYVERAADRRAFDDFTTQWKAYETLRDAQMLPAAASGDIATFVRVRDDEARPVLDAAMADLRTAMAASAAMRRCSRISLQRSSRYHRCG